MGAGVGAREADRFILLHKPEFVLNLDVFEQRGGTLVVSDSSLHHLLQEALQLLVHFYDFLQVLVHELKLLSFDLASLVGLQPNTDPLVTHLRKLSHMNPCLLTKADLACPEMSQLSQTFCQQDLVFLDVGDIFFDKSAGFRRFVATTANHFE